MQSKKEKKAKIKKNKKKYSNPNKVLTWEKWNEYKLLLTKSAFKILRKSTVKELWNDNNCFY